VSSAIGRLFKDERYAFALKRTPKLFD